MGHTQSEGTKGGRRTADDIANAAMTRANTALANIAGNVASQAGFVRVVATNIPAYTGTGTSTLTGSVNGALPAEDGVTLALNDQVLLPEGLTHVSPADTGPWLVAALGAAGSKWSLQRPSWWTTGSVVTPGATISVGGEGAIWSGNSFKAMAAKGAIVGANTPSLYPRLCKITAAVLGTSGGESGSYTWGASGDGAAIMVWTGACVLVSANTLTGTPGANKLALNGPAVPGVIGVGSVLVASYGDGGVVDPSDSSTVNIVVFNW
jgi:hypothetical protein